MKGRGFTADGGAPKNKKEIIRERGKQDIHNAWGQENKNTNIMVLSQNDAWRMHDHHKTMNSLDFQLELVLVVTRPSYFIDLKEPGGLVRHSKPCRTCLRDGFISE